MFNIQQYFFYYQSIFLQVHPVYYLNSRHKGIGVQTMTEASNKSVNLENIDSTSLFSESITDGGISELLDYSRNLSHWVSAEVLSCSSPKVGSKSHSCHHILWKVLTVCHRLWHKCKVFNIPGPRMSATWHSTLLRWTMASYQ